VECGVVVAGLHFYKWIGVGCGTSYVEKGNELIIMRTRLSRVPTVIIRFGVMNVKAETDIIGALLPTIIHFSLFIIHYS
jgi:hypothetical protein